MSKPEDISEGLWDTTYELLYLAPDLDGQRANVARAIMAAEKRGEERERDACAQVVTTLVDVLRDEIAALHFSAPPTHKIALSDQRRVLQTAIAAIRKRGEG